MKVIVRANSGDKKLIGIVPFDVAELANSSKHTAQHFKRPLLDTPDNFTGSISYQMFVKYLGEGGDSASSQGNPTLSNKLALMRSRMEEESFQE